jgi:protein-L-isoaspartate(D-aspartate) O-methyltransferase
MNLTSWAGFEQDGPYDAIHVGAAAPTLPQPLVDQLAAPGRMFIPVGTHQQAILQVDKDEHGQVTTKEVLDVMVCARCQSSVGLS